MPCGQPCPPAIAPCASAKDVSGGGCTPGFSVCLRRGAEGWFYLGTNPGDYTPQISRLVNVTSLEMELFTGADCDNLESLGTITVSGNGSMPTGSSGSFAAVESSAGVWLRVLPASTGPVVSCNMPWITVGFDVCVTGTGTCEDPFIVGVGTTGEFVVSTGTGPKVFKFTAPTTGTYHFVLNYASGVDASGGLVVGDGGCYPTAPLTLSTSGAGVCGDAVLAADSEHFVEIANASIPGATYTLTIGSGAC